MTASIAESDDLNAISYVSNSVSSFVPEKVLFKYRTAVLDSKKQALKTAKTATSTSASASVFASKKQDKNNKKRKAQAAVLSSATVSDNENFQLNSSFYIQKAIDNLNIAAAKELNAKIQQKIQKIAANTQQILLNESELELDSNPESES